MPSNFAQRSKSSVQESQQVGHDQGDHPQLRIVPLSPPGCRWRRDDRTRRWPLARTRRGDRRGKCKDGSPGRVADERMAGRLSACGGIVVRSYAPSKRATGHPAPIERATTIHEGEGRGARSKVTSWPRSEVNRRRWPKRLPPRRQNKYGESV